MTSEEEEKMGGSASQKPTASNHAGSLPANDLPWGSVRSRKFGGDAVLHVGGWYHCQCYPCPRLTKWSSIVWNSSVCPSCTVKKQRVALAKTEARS